MTNDARTPIRQPTLFRPLVISVSGTDQASADRIPDEAGDFMDIQFAHDAGSMGFGCLGANVQKACTLFGRLALSNEL
jgi:hypothetical protein